MIAFAIASLAINPDALFAVDRRHPRFRARDYGSSLNTVPIVGP